MAGPRLRSSLSRRLPRCRSSRWPQRSRRGATNARADGDPASDVLLGENVFYPYSPAVSTALQTELNAETAQAAHAGLPLKVALIASPVDLGVIPSLFEHPQQYANFLDQEISFQTRQPLLVVMPAGYGVQGLSPAATAAAQSLRKPAGTTSNDLASAALIAVARLAGAAGHPIKAGSSGSVTTGGGAGGGGALLIAIVAAVAVAAAAGVVTLRRRSARSG